MYLKHSKHETVIQDGFGRGGVISSVARKREMVRTSHELALAGLGIVLEFNGRLLPAAFAQFFRVRKPPEKCF